MARSARRRAGTPGPCALVAAACVICAFADARRAAAESLIGAAGSVSSKNGDASPAGIGAFGAWNSPIGVGVHTWYGVSGGDEAKMHHVIAEGAVLTPLRGMGIVLRPYLGAGLELRAETQSRSATQWDVQPIVGAGFLWYLPRHAVFTAEAQYGIAHQSVAARVAISRRF